MQRLRRLYRIRYWNVWWCLQFSYQKVIHLWFQRTCDQCCTQNGWCSIKECIVSQYQTDIWEFWMEFKMLSSFREIEQKTDCLNFIARISSGIAVVFNVGTFQTEPGTCSQQLISLVYEKGHGFSTYCAVLCGSICLWGKNDCVKAYCEAIVFSTSLGKSYHNMPMRYFKQGEMVPDNFPLPQTSKYLWVEHEREYSQFCQSFMKSIYEANPRTLSPIDFIALLTTEWNMPNVSQCIWSDLIRNKGY